MAFKLASFVEAFHFHLFHLLSQFSVVNVGIFFGVPHCPAFRNRTEDWLTCYGGCGVTVKA